MMTFDRAEKFRQHRPVGIMPATKTGNPFGVFIMGVPGQSQIRMIACDSVETGWDHVSVSKLVIGKNGKAHAVTPTWEEMCVIKDLFWDENDCVVQFHPPKQDYVNTHNNCLHLWKKVGENFETPDKMFV